MNVLYVVVALFIIACAAAMAWLIANAEPFDEDDEQGWPAEPTPPRPQAPRDIAIGDQYVAERLNALRRIQTSPRREEERRASARLSKGW